MTRKQSKNNHTNRPGKELHHRFYSFIRVRMTRNLNLLPKMKQFSLPLRSAAVALFAAWLFVPVHAQVDDCDGTRYRYTSAFENFNVSYDVEYGNAINATGLSQSLVVDIYEPEGDANTMRPLIICVPWRIALSFLIFTDKLIFISTPIVFFRIFSP